MFLLAVNETSSTFMLVVNLRSGVFIATEMIVKNRPMSLRAVYFGHSIIWFHDLRIGR
jgi:hypothetical protein